MSHVQITALVMHRQNHRTYTAHIFRAESARPWAESWEAVFDREAAASHCWRLTPITVAPISMEDFRAATRCYPFGQNQV